MEKVKSLQLPLAKGKLAPKVTDEVGMRQLRFHRFLPKMENLVQLLPLCKSARKPLYFQHFEQKFSLKTIEKQLTFGLKTC